MTSRALILNMKRRQWVRRLPTGAAAAAAGQERHVQPRCTTERESEGEKRGKKSKTGHDNRFANWHPSVQGSIGLTHSISLTQSVHISLPLSLFLFFSPPFPRNCSG